MVDVRRYFVVALCFISFQAIHGDRRIDGSIILPPLPLHPDAPLCTSYSGLCHMTYTINVTDDTLRRRHPSPRVWQSDAQICRCPNDGHCALAWSDMTNSIIKRFKNEGVESQVKISYCSLNLPSTVCQQNEAALVTRGRGPFQFEIHEDFRCLCHRDLYAHRSWSEGQYDYTEYSCGKPRCSSNRVQHNNCVRVTLNPNERGHLHEYLCRCRRNQVCTGGAELRPTDQDTASMDTSGQVLYKQCHHVGNGNRRRLRRRLNKQRRH